MAAILDLKIFTNVINKYLNYKYVNGYFQMQFYPLYLKSCEKFAFSMSAILECKMRPSWAKSRVFCDRFEIGLPKLPYTPMSCFIVNLNNSRFYVL